MSVWLIEMNNNEAPVPRYWNGSKFKGGWVWDANEAIRFCRKQDAQDFLDGDRLVIGGRPVEHVFLPLRHCDDCNFSTAEDDVTICPECRGCVG